MARRAERHSQSPLPILHQIGGPADCPVLKRLRPAFFGRIVYIGAGRKLAVPGTRRLDERIGDDHGRVHEVAFVPSHELSKRQSIVCLLCVRQNIEGVCVWVGWGGRHIIATYFEKRTIGAAARANSPRLNGTLSIRCGGDTCHKWLPPMCGCMLFFLSRFLTQFLAHSLPCSAPGARLAYLCPPIFRRAAWRLLWAFSAALCVVRASGH